MFGSTIRHGWLLECNDEEDGGKGEEEKEHVDEEARKDWGYNNSVEDIISKSNKGQLSSTQCLSLLSCVRASEVTSMIDITPEDLVYGPLSRGKIMDAIANARTLAHLAFLEAGSEWFATSLTKDITTAIRILLHINSVNLA
jgi:hypothetical protein